MFDCIFCKIINKEIPKDLIYESDELVVFEDIKPSADVHLLIVPKEHIEAMADLTDMHGVLLAKIYQVAKKLTIKYNLTNDLYRVVVNGGKAQHVPHIHFHLIGGQWKRAI